jgi:TetR/AcrR family transcriptional regulator, ethionamide resistance regulator
MSEPTVSRRARRRREVAEELLEAAKPLFAQGERFAEISVARLCEEADISRTTFYVYFDEGKPELLQAWFDDVMEELEGISEAWWKLDGTSRRDDLRSVITEIAGAYHRHADALAAVFEGALFEEPLSSAVDEVLDRNAASLESHLRRGQEQSWVDPSLPARESAQWLIMLLERAQLRIVQGVDPVELQMLIEAQTELLWNMLYLSSGSDRRAA